MSIGSSGRIVIELDPEVKRHLYSALARDGLTLKDWFIKEAATYVAKAEQLHYKPASRDTSTVSDFSANLSKRRVKKINKQTTDPKLTIASVEAKAHDE